MVAAYGAVPYVLSTWISLQSDTSAKEANRTISGEDRLFGERYNFLLRNFIVPECRLVLLPVGFWRHDWRRFGEGY